MQINKTLALAALVTLLSSGAALAAESAMKMDCCAKCECCKDKKDAPKSFEPGSEHRH
ncbi:hypothetical protein [Phenylobacterium sp.]|jgi:hypothetical protein|uniref:hypothetical protein n=1 Tax=Phenylobacterium sp. TaxID=1871053 RepID=UPI0035AF4D2F